jgi:acid phosphatase type 7
MRNSLLLLLGLLASFRVVGAEPGDQPPRFELPGPVGGAALTFVVYGDTRFTAREHVAHADARRALVARIASENPAAIFVGGDLVYEGSDPEDYKIYKSETTEWSSRKIPVFPALGNHEFKGCTEEDANPCLENWWAMFGSLRPHRWYTVTIGATLLVVILDSNAPLRPGSGQRQWFEQQITEADQRFPFILVLLHYPPVRGPFYPAMLDERDIAHYLSRKSGSLRAQVVVVGSHVHNYERFNRDGIAYLVSGGGGANPVPAVRMFGELSKLTTGVNFHYLRFVLDGDRLTGTMVRFDDKDKSGNPWTEPDRFEVRAKH